MTVLYNKNSESTTVLSHLNNKFVAFKNSTMLSGEHSRNNNLIEQEFRETPIPVFLYIHTIDRNMFYSKYFITWNTCRRFLAFQYKHEFKMCDQYAIGIIHFPHGDIDHGTEWDLGLLLLAFFLLPHLLLLFLSLFLLQLREAKGRNG